MKLILLVAYAILGSLGLTLIKKSLNTSSFSLCSFKSNVLITGFGLYVFSFILWLKILKQNELSNAFPIASAVLFIFISLFSSFLFVSRG
jgi:hypothetical protein